MGAWVHSFSARDYHADKVSDVPTLSSSMARLLCTSSPRHAWTAHPKLNPEWTRVSDDEAKFDVGNVVHALLLEETDLIEIVDAKDWRTDKAKDARAEARAAGKIPLLASQEERVRDMLEAVRVQLDAFPGDPPLLRDGSGEKTLVWDEDGVMCRARLDWLHTSRSCVDDVKTTKASARADQYERTLMGIGGDIQAAFYLRGLQAVTGGQRQADFRWIVMETSPPYAVSVLSPKPSLLDLGNRKVDYALNLWRECLDRDEWPGYEPRIWWADAPPWEIERWLGVDPEWSPE